MRRIDAHQHYWRLSRGDYGWLKPELGVLYRDYMPADLEPHLREHNIQATVLVQAAPTLAETEFMLQLSDCHDSIAGVVGWLDLEADDFGHVLDALRRHPKFKGVRPMLQDLADDRWILRPNVLRSLELLAERDIPIDFLTFPRHLPHLVTVLQKVPNLRGVVDHLSKPAIAKRELQPWQDWLAEVAQFPSVWCKLSGMVTEADHRTWRYEDFVPYVEHALRVFGPNRVMFGSDWPVCLLAASYGQVIDVLRAALGKELIPQLEAAVFGENAARFYRL